MGKTMDKIKALSGGGRKDIQVHSFTGGRTYIVDLFFVSQEDAQNRTFLVVLRYGAHFGSFMHIVSYLSIVSFNVKVLKA